MEFNVLDWERPILNSLAEKQACYSALPIMEDRKKIWFASNTGRGGSRQPIVIEEWTFDRDFMPDSIYRCESALGR